jgi:hypothetical protein
MRATTCKHYTGILGGDILDKEALAARRCAAGVVHTDVKEPGTGRGIRFPCVDSQCGTLTCPQHEYPSQAEIEAQEREIAAFVERMARVVAGELMECLHCGAAVERWREVRPCVYAEPCGHRQYQWRAPEAHQ